MLKEAWTTCETKSTDEEKSQCKASLIKGQPYKNTSTGTKVPLNYKIYLKLVVEGLLQFLDVGDMTLIQNHL